MDIFGGQMAKLEFLLLAPNDIIFVSLFVHDYSFYILENNPSK